MTTDDDIVRALEGKPTAAKARADEAIRRAFSGQPSHEEEVRNDAISEAFGRKRERRAQEGELPVRARGDELEATSIWAAKEAATRATRELAESIMRSDAGKNIYAAESEAKEIAAEAYSNAAKKTPHEDTRHREVERITRSMAQRIGRPRSVEAKRTTAKPATATESTTFVGRRRVQISEVGRTGRISNL